MVMSTEQKTQTQQIEPEEIKVYMRRNGIYAERHVKLKYGYVFKVKLVHNEQISELTPSQIEEAVERAKLTLERCTGRIQERLNTLVDMMSKLNIEWYSWNESEHFMFEYLRDIECVEHVVAI